MKAHIKHIAFIIALALIGCATPIDVHTASTAQLLDRRAEIDRKLKEDDLGVAWGMSRWISHASEKHKVIKERQAIDAELARRHATPQESAPEKQKSGAG